ncbi:polyphosphate kinase 2 [Hyphobacterium sp. HN65]|uniref:ADP/GDP-polyphosphate phosphotransferase n=1 Tax=Hyphobacterium lacteum TaxID=3116575 RepID=A0ABU7LLT0_9PROT|nr:polyphosphate kinase 2 [Hyphobacterium sp. HN65]MEE2524852.1 polyphosphate kinase 2 [Hyphobacterium sp. HN65]
MEKGAYRKALRQAQINLVDLQRDVIARGRRLLVILEGRDASGKDGTIKRIAEHQSPRETRVIALGKPTERERTSWYFQRWVEFLPAQGEFVLFNRSWYNRAGVERVMGFCSDDEYESFLNDVGGFEKILTDDGLIILKYYLDISKSEQAARLEDRRRNPLKTWKISPIDAVALEKWDDYSAARNRMLVETCQPLPWRVVKADDKYTARLTVIHDILRTVDCGGYSGAVPEHDMDVLRYWGTPDISGSFLAP